MLFYGITMVVLYLVTATKRTAEARLPLFFLLTVNFVLERLIRNHVHKHKPVETKQNK